MDELGLNQLSTAKRAGLGADYVRDILRGKIKEPSGVKLSQLAAALECSTAYLLGQDDAIGSPPPGLMKQVTDVTAWLPITHRLAKGVFRFSSSPDPELPDARYLTTITAAHNAAVWLALVEDNHADRYVPAGYIVQVVDSDGWDETSPPPSPLAVIERYRDNGDLVERTLQHLRFMDQFSMLLADMSNEPNHRGDGQSGSSAVSRRDPQFKIIGWVVEASRRFDGLGDHVFPRP
jgi:transcriptional regulator with XRE-family HTH domain